MAEKNQLPAPAKTPGAPAPETDSAVEAPATVREPVRIDIEVTVNQPAAAAPTADLPQPITAEPAVLSVASDLIATADADIGHSVGEDPAAPAVTPLGWTLLAAARRELGASPTRVQVGAGALATPTGAAGSGLFANPITVAPVVPQFTDGIINGYVTATDANGLPLFYSLVSPPTEGGKVALNGDIGRFAYLPDLAVLNAGGTESFGVLVSERTPFVAALEGLIDLSDARAIIRGIVASLQQMPIVNLLLEPLIGRATMQQITLVNSALVPSPADTPVAYTTKIVSFDGTLISTNYFPAAGLQSGQTAPAVFTTAGLSSPGQTDPYAQWDSSILFAPLVLGVAPLREAGYSVVTWDSRGKAASGGVLELGAPEFEGRDFRAIVDYYAALDVIAADETGDPLIGTIGGSYGGGMQLVNAALDPRIDAIVPGIAWNTLTGSLYPTQTFSTVLGALLPALLLSAGARINPQIYIAALSGVLLGTIPAFSEALLARTGPGEGAADITAPTLLIQGIPDTTFPLEEAVINARLIDGAGTPVKMIWYCGGHGVCLNPQNPDHDELILGATLSWLDRYVRNETLPAELPTFQWVDQFGVPWGSDLMPFDPGFHGRPLTVTGAGGVMPILSVLGGGGPSLVSLPLSLLATGPAINAVNVSITAPSAVQIVGAPEVTFTYAGVGTASHLYAQIVDDKTGLVLSNGATPIPVRLNGSSHTVTVSLADVAHNLATGESVTLQLSNAALPFYDFLSVGVVGISDVRLSLPTVADGVAMSLRPVSA
jgi:ABC-2 type transport system ATP-binding protein